jgi:chain length determinant protein tyrosine kinase EpsG
MAKFRDSTLGADPRDTVGPAETSMSIGHTAAPDATNASDRTIGDILAELRNLSADQVAKILQQQQATGVRFGEAAVALGMVSKDDILFALAKQFNYPYASDATLKLGAELVALNEPFSARAESFRALRTQLMMRVFTEGRSSTALAIISPDSSDGKTYTACNLAVALAQLGGRTLLVDADMRTPRVHELFKLNNASGLSSVLSGRADKQVIQQIIALPNLYVLPVGTTPPNPLELVERPAFGLLMTELTSKFDYVVVDTPSASAGADGAVVAARCGAALVVARKDESRTLALRELVASFQGAAVKIAGVVFNEH